MLGSFRPTVKAPPARVPLRLADSDRLAFVLQEYAAVWAEIHTSLASQVSVLAFGAAAVGLLMSAAAQLWMTASLVAGLLLLLAAPAVCFLALAIYLGEQVRLMRAGLFLYRLEETANHSTIDLGRNLGLRVVAEGVENSLTLQQLSLLGCPAVQGYHISRPVAPDDLLGWLEQQTTTPTTAPTTDGNGSEVARAH
jgi:hypothetical protein